MKREEEGSEVKRPKLEILPDDHLYMTRPIDQYLEQQLVEFDDKSLVSVSKVPKDERVMPEVKCVRSKGRTAMLVGSGSKGQRWQKRKRISDQVKAAPISQEKKNYFISKLWENRGDIQKLYEIQ